MYGLLTSTTIKLIFKKNLTYYHNPSILILIGLFVSLLYISKIKYIILLNICVLKTILNLSITNQSLSKENKMFALRNLKENPK